MGDIKKESLDKLLVFIGEICRKEKYEWFKEKLISNLGCENNNIGNSSLQLSKIEEYLKLDGYKIIDYTAIKNVRVRNQLFRDCIEMSKYRLGKINDTISFDEFCRYAHLQVEELLNYFYHEKFNGNYTEANKFITKHWETYSPPNSKKISAISISAKTTGFLGEYGFSNTTLSRNLDFLRDYRNELSHRNSYELRKEDEVLATISVKNINIQNSFIDFRTTSKTDQDLHKKGRFIYLKRAQNYKEIIESLEILKEAIIAILQ